MIGYSSDSSSSSSSGSSSCGSSSEDEDQPTTQQQQQHYSNPHNSLSVNSYNHTTSHCDNSSSSNGGVGYRIASGSSPSPRSKQPTRTTTSTQRLLSPSPPSPPSPSMIPPRRGKSLVFVKLNDSALDAILEAVAVSRARGGTGPVRGPLIRFESDNRGVIMIPDCDDAGTSANGGRDDDDDDDDANNTMKSFSFSLQESAEKGSLEVVHQVGGRLPPTSSSSSSLPAKSSYSSSKLLGDTNNQRSNGQQACLASYELISSDSPAAHGLNGAGGGMGRMVNYGGVTVKLQMSASDDIFAKTKARVARGQEEEKNKSAKEFKPSSASVARTSKTGAFSHSKVRVKSSNGHASSSSSTLLAKAAAAASHSNQIRTTTSGASSLPKGVARKNVTPLTSSLSASSPLNARTSVPSGGPGSTGPATPGSQSVISNSSSRSDSSSNHSSSRQGTTMAAGHNHSPQPHHHLSANSNHYHSNGSTPTRTTVNNNNSLKPTATTTTNMTSYSKSYSPSRPAGAIVSGGGGLRSTLPAHHALNRNHSHHGGNSSGGSSASSSASSTGGSSSRTTPTPSPPLLNGLLNSQLQNSRQAGRHADPSPTLAFSSLPQVREQELTLNKRTRDDSDDDSDHHDDDDEEALGQDLERELMDHDDDKREDHRSSGSTDHSNKHQQQQPLTSRTLKLRQEFDRDYEEYERLHEYMEAERLKFVQLNAAIQREAEGSDDWNRLVDQLAREYGKLKKNNKYHESRARYLSLHDKLSNLRKLLVENS